MQNGVLQNDIDVDGDDLTLSLADNVNSGTLELNSNGTFIYEPIENFVGVDRFTHPRLDRGAHQPGERLFRLLGGVGG